MRQRYRYDSANVRTVKQTLETLTDTNTDGYDDLDGDTVERLTLYVYPGDFERKGLKRDAATSTYIAAVAKNGATVVSLAETQYVVGGARVMWEATTQPTRLDGTVTETARATIGIGDLIGTTGAVLDLESGELVEASTYYPNGARERYVRNSGGDDNAIAPEPMGFTGKEGDEEVGLTYFGERYLVSRIGRWASPDPLQIHAAGGGEVGNSCHYVSGNLLKGRDPLGLEDPPADAGVDSANGAMQPAGVEANDHTGDTGPGNAPLELEIPRLGASYGDGMGLEALGMALDLAESVVVGQAQRPFLAYDRVINGAIDAFSGENASAAHHFWEALKLMNPGIAMMSGGYDAVLTLVDYSSAMSNASTSEEQGRLTMGR